MLSSKEKRMHGMFGKTEKLRCGDCRNLIRVNVGSKVVFKCLIYGDTASDATDWRLKYIACGAFNQPIPRNWKPVIRTTGRNENEPEKPLEGQITLEDIFDE